MDQFQHHNANDDSSKSLAEIAQYHTTSIVSLLLQIQNSKAPIEKFIDFVRKLECFRPVTDVQGTRLYRETINAMVTNQQRYIAVSYTWDPSDHEDAASGQYSVQACSDSGGHHFAPSPVRNCVFDQNYRAGVRMSLLIKHAPSLEEQKQEYPTSVFGGFPEKPIPGELCLSSTIFSARATGLCLAICQGQTVPSQDVREMADHVLDTAGRYIILLNKTRDRLAITANCCQYSTRLEVTRLAQQGLSLSLSTLAMSLLNGEILHNDRIGWEGDVSQLSVSHYIKQNFFRKFQSPVATPAHLTFNKGCRLLDVELTTTGVQTVGHLWKLGKTIDTSKLPHDGYSYENPVDNKKCQLETFHRRQLERLLKELRIQQYHPLAIQLEKYLQEDHKFSSSLIMLQQNSRNSRFFYEDYKLLMAIELADAVANGSKLRLGCLWHPQDDGKKSPISSMSRASTSSINSSATSFTNTSASTYANSQTSFTSRMHNNENFVFTALRPRKSDAGIAHHVSLQVRLDGTLQEISDTADTVLVPRLRVQRWMLGMCFTTIRSPSRVVFPWPSDFEAIVPPSSSPRDAEKFPRWVV
ncbi:hypothetical protein B0T17DRAFT_510900 [Bombardia bombarda]|uniref:Uncharacterized protein n=1 Tax=Bombardia bombarda TaxID=252184 RepID=A0AA39WGS2_9PEZI|nr:hypothetical protein B0T17DRAFT_510900 [Bombardia bombarda]